MSQKVCILSSQEAELIEYNWSIGHRWKPNCAHHDHCTKAEAQELNKKNITRQISLPQTPNGRWQYITFTIAKTWKAMRSGGVHVMQLTDVGAPMMRGKGRKDRIGREPIKLGQRPTFTGKQALEFQR